jgi:hypothetical protein
LALSIYLELHVTIDPSQNENCKIKYEGLGKEEEGVEKPDVNLITRTALYAHISPLPI